MGGYMGFRENYQFELLKNEAENLVINELERQLETYHESICRCNDCVLDIATMALNTVKSRYHVSLMGTLYASVAMDEQTYASSVRDAVFRAIERVHKNPSHEPHARET